MGDIFGNVLAQSRSYSCSHFTSVSCACFSLFCLLAEWQFIPNNAVNCWPQRLNWRSLFYVAKFHTRNTYSGKQRSSTLFQESAIQWIIQDEMSLLKQAEQWKMRRGFFDSHWGKILTLAEMTLNQNTTEDVSCSEEWNIWWKPPRWTQLTSLEIQIHLIIYLLF